MSPAASALPGMMSKVNSQNTVQSTHNKTAAFADSLEGTSPYVSSQQHSAQNCDRFGPDENFAVATSSFDAGTLPVDEEEKLSSQGAIQVKDQSERGHSEN